MSWKGLGKEDNSWEDLEFLKRWAPDLNLEDKFAPVDGGDATNPIELEVDPNYIRDQLGLGDHPEHTEGETGQQTCATLDVWLKVPVPGTLCAMVPTQDRTFVFYFMFLF